MRLTARQDARWSAWARPGRISGRDTTAARLARARCSGERCARSQGDAMGGARAARVSMCSRMVATTRGSVITANTRIAAPQRGHRLSSFAQCRRRLPRRLPERGHASRAYLASELPKRVRSGCDAGRRLSMLAWRQQPPSAAPRTRAADIFSDLPRRSAAESLEGVRESGRWLVDDHRRFGM